MLRDASEHYAALEQNRVRISAGDTEMGANVTMISQRSVAARVLFFRCVSMAPVAVPAPMHSALAHCVVCTRFAYRSQHPAAADQCGVLQESSADEVAVRTGRNLVRVQRWFRNFALLSKCAVCFRTALRECSAVGAHSENASNRVVSLLPYPYR